MTICKYALQGWLKQAHVAPESGKCRSFESSARSSWPSSGTGWNSPQKTSPCASNSLSCSALPGAPGCDCAIGYSGSGCPHSGDTGAALCSSSSLIPWCDGIERGSDSTGGGNVDKGAAPGWRREYGASSGRCHRRISLGELRKSSDSNHGGVFGRHNTWSVSKGFGSQALSPRPPDAICRPILHRTRTLG